MQVRYKYYKQICRILTIDYTLTSNTENKKINKVVSVLHKDYLLSAAIEARNVIDRDNGIKNKYGLMITIYNRKLKEHQALVLLIQLFEIAMRTQAAIILSEKFSNNNQDDWYQLPDMNAKHRKLKNKVRDRALIVGLTITPNTSTLDMFHSLMMNDIQVIYQRNWNDFLVLFNNTQYKNNNISPLTTHAMFNARFERIRKYRNSLYHGNPGSSGWRQIIEDIEDILVQLNYNLEDAINNIDPKHNIITLKYQYSSSAKNLTLLAKIKKSFCKILLRE